MLPVRKISSAAATLALLTTPLVATAPATAAPAPPAAQAAAGLPEWLRPPVLPIEIGADGFAIPGPDPRRTGVVSFRIGTPDPAGYYWGIGRARDGITYERVQELERLSSSPDPAVSVPALRALYAAVEYCGGAGTFGGQAPITATMLLEPGDYQATARTAAISPDPNAQVFLDSLRVARRPDIALPPRVDAVIRMVEDSAGRTTYALPERLPAHGTYLFVNETSQPHEAVFGGVGPTTTDEDVAAYFAAVRAGQRPPPVFLSRVGGLMAISPGRWLALTVDFTPGRYSVQSFYRNPDTGVGRAYEGMHRVVDLY
ncbi:hypothetical protein O7635_02630 [Asanoa sp. WMMD1127]|uniref:hypothetical protein n=1 Tax=Asanoa sp. WMMD1127 TaxID=3016107 RepID=UPI0024179092|nr:hypothetical protein [Asanoa sp. WMMD1127]MDG4820746.1 hypothetical protein [Asanoa sp. WMMD1127]